MAVTVTNILVGSTNRIFDVEATADADTGSGNVAHGLAETPLEVVLTPLLAAARISDWILTTRDGTNVAVGKTTTVGSGAAGAQVRVHASLPHSIVR